MNTDRDIFFGAAFALIGALLIICGALLGELDAPLFWRWLIVIIGGSALVCGALLIDEVRQ